MLIDAHSPRPLLQKSAFGAKLMLEPELVRDVARSMVRELRIPVTIKCRLGADDMNTYEELANFVRVTAASGVKHYIIHARICLLNGLSAKDNRTIPPLRYEWVYRLAREFPDLRVSINGGITSLEQAGELLRVPREGTGGPPAPRPVMGHTGAGVPGARPKVKGWGGPAETYTGSLGMPSKPHKVALRKASEALCAAGGNDDNGDGDRGGDEAPGSAARAAASAGSGSGSGSGSAEREGSVGAAGAGAEAKGIESRRERKARRRRQRRGSEDDGDDGDDAAGFGADAAAGGLSAAEREALDDPALNGTALLDSVMVGRFAYNNPWALCDVDRRLFGDANPGLSRRDVVREYLSYVDDLHDKFGDDAPALKPRVLMKPILKLFAGSAGGSNYRTMMTDGACRRGANLRDMVAHALEAVPASVLDARPPGGVGRGRRSDA